MQHNTTQYNTLQVHPSVPVGAIHERRAIWHLLCATHYITLQHPATPCNTVQVHQLCLLEQCMRDAPSCTSFAQHTASHCVMLILQHTATYCIALHHTATPCITLQHTVTHCNTMQHHASHCVTLHHTATPCNTLQHNTPQYNTLQVHPNVSVWIYTGDCNTPKHCNTLQHKKKMRVRAIYGRCTILHLLCATLCNALHHTATHRITLQHTVSPFNALQHNATHCRCTSVCLFEIKYER